MGKTHELSKSEEDNISKRRRTDESSDRTHSLVQLLRDATEVVDGIVVKCAKEICKELTRDYATGVYADALYRALRKELYSKEHAGKHLRLERSVSVPIRCGDDIIDNMTTEAVVYTSNNRALMVIAVKTKRTALKESDAGYLMCAVEQIGKTIYEADVDPPTAMVVNFN